MTMCLAAACTATPVHAGSAAVREGAVRIANGYLANVVSRAIEGASERLAEPGCQQVFEQFSDRAGRRLTENLAALGRDGRSFVAGLFYYDGENHDLCRRGALAVTHVGGRAVQVCGNRFRQVWLDDPVLAEAVIIHEALHGLGLGENPPSSDEITARVRKLCRRKAS